MIIPAIKIMNNRVNNIIKRTGEDVSGFGKTHSPFIHYIPVEQQNKSPQHKVSPSQIDIEPSEL